MKEIRLTGAKSIEDQVIITITAGEPTDEVIEKEAALFSQELIDALPIGAIFQLVDLLNAELTKVAELYNVFKRLKEFAVALGIPEEELEDK